MSIDSGILIINKEKGFTSFDVVAKLRGILHIKKIGHTGTLDPDAEGVLCVCIGKATKLIEYMTEHDKEYETTLLLGTVTDTQDISGEVISLSDVPSFDRSEIEAAIRHFTGDIDQVPPMYSAKKVNGQRLYEAARNGIEIERKPVRIHVESIDILGMDENRIRLHISCSKGTYIRTLCHDIGQFLGCGGCMEKLDRTRVGEFGIDQAHTLSEIEEYVKKGRLDEVMLPIDSVLTEYPAFTCSQDAFKRLQNGNKLFSEDLIFKTPAVSDMIRVYTPEGVFAAVYKRNGDHYKVDKYFL